MTQEKRKAFTLTQEFHNMDDIFNLYSFKKLEEKLEKKNDHNGLDQYIDKERKKKNFFKNRISSNCFT